MIILACHNDIVGKLDIKISVILAALCLVSFPVLRLVLPPVTRVV